MRNTGATSSRDASPRASSASRARVSGETSARDSAPNRDGDTLRSASHFRKPFRASSEPPSINQFVSIEARKSRGSSFFGSGTGSSSKRSSATSARTSLRAGPSADRTGRKRSSFLIGRKARDRKLLRGPLMEKPPDTGKSFKVPIDFSSKYMAASEPSWTRRNRRGLAERFATLRT